MKMRSATIHVVMQLDYEDRAPMAAWRNKSLAEKDARERRERDPTHHYEVTQIPLLEPHHL